MLVSSALWQGRSGEIDWGDSRRVGVDAGRICGAVAGPEESWISWVMRSERRRREPDTRTKVQVLK